MTQAEGGGVVMGGQRSGPLDLDAAPSTEDYELGKLEQRGIELIPESDRKMRPSGLFFLWAGAIWNVEFLVYGALVVSFGLSFWQAVSVILIGNLFYVVLGIASLWGPETGTTAFMVSRAPFGRNGNRAPSLFNWITQVGFEIEGLVIVAYIVEAMFSREGTTLGDAGKVVLVLCAVAVQFIAPFLGHATITKVLRYLSYVFVVVFVIMAILVIPHAHLSDLHTTGTDSWWLWTTGLVLIVSAGGLGWTENAADYSRYLPRSTPKSQTFWAATLGGAIPSILLELLGATAYLVSPSVTAAAAVPAAFASWFFWPFMILALPQLFAINSIDMYSSGVTLQAIGIPLKRWGCVLVDTVISGAVTIVIVLKGHFYADLEGFLDYIVVWLGPWFGILLVDYLLRRGRYDVVSLAGRRGGLYWRSGGINWKAIVSLAAGMFGAMMWIDAAFYNPAYTGPLSNATHGADFSWIFGMIVAGLVYWVLSMSSVRKEADASSGRLDMPVS
ncbi:MAG: purine-cytosine permease family protein [Acidimicrobiales bacterium]|jgi:NCS1 nucleoside transporter family